jgi:hypothetical protein
VAIAHVHLSDWLVKKCSSYYFLTLPFIVLCTLYLNPPVIYGSSRRIYCLGSYFINSSGSTCMAKL